MDWVAVVRERVAPAAGADLPDLTASGLGVALVAALALVLLQPMWRTARLAVTLVHELGHAAVGIAVGRRFTGFVVRGDMSGHAVTAGPAGGMGRVATAWAGYPAPAVVGAAMVWLAVRGWAAPLITAALAVVLIAAWRVRSLFTALVVAGALLSFGALWWWRDEVVQQLVLVTTGLVLIVGAWRHIGAVIRHGGGSDDPAVLARLTRVPRVVWNLSFVGVAAASTWLVADQLTPVLRG